MQLSGPSPLFIYLSISEPGLSPSREATGSDHSIPLQSLALAILALRGGTTCWAFPLGGRRYLFTLP